MFRTAKSTETEQIHGCRGLGEGELGRDSKGCRVSLWGAENILEGHSGHTSTICKYIKPTVLYTLRGEESHVNHIPIKQLNQLKPLKPAPCPAGGLGRARGRRLSVHVDFHQVEVGPGCITHKQAARAGRSLTASAVATESGNTKHLPTIITGHLLHTWARPWGQALEPKS